MTHTYAIAEVSRSAYQEIRAILVKAGYSDQIHSDRTEEVLDMHGLALRESQEKTPHAVKDQL